MILTGPLEKNSLELIELYPYKVSLTYTFLKKNLQKHTLNGGVKEFRQQQGLLK
jgi:hypothetical protein